MLLIFPPVAKPGESPAGVAKLAGALKAHNIPCTILDANLEGLIWLLNARGDASDTWTRRAVKNSARNLAALRDPRTYRTPDRYNRAVQDTNRVLFAASREFGAIVNLADYQHEHWSPLRSADLIAAAEDPEKNPFFLYFSERLPKVFEQTLSQQRHQGEAHPAIGFSLNYLSQALCAFAMMGFIRKQFPGIRLILGGGLVTSWAQAPGWGKPFAGLVDHLVTGPGENALLTLLGVSDIKHDAALPDHCSLSVDSYLSPGFVLPYSASSGCYWRKCSFCPETAEDNPYQAIPAPRALDDLKELTTGLKPVLVHLLDNAVSPALMRSFADRPLGVPWYGFARISRELLDLEYCHALKRSGCVMLKLGLESGAQRVLDALQKGIDLQTASRVLSNLRKAGIATYVYLLFGTPAESEEDAGKTLEFTVRHHDSITFLNLAVFNMPVCAQEAGDHASELFYDGDLSLYTGFRHPRGWDRKQVRRFLDAEFKRHPAVAAILKRDPPVFTSNHAAFFVEDFESRR